MLGDTEVAFESARSQFWVVDANVSNLLIYFKFITDRQDEY